MSTELGSAYSSSHSFVIRLWRENVPAAGQSAVWRGHIIHFPDQRDRHFDDLEEVCRFIESVLEPAAAEPDSDL